LIFFKEGDERDRGGRKGQEFCREINVGGGKMRQRHSLVLLCFGNGKVNHVLAGSVGADREAGVFGVMPLKKARHMLRTSAGLPVVATKIFRGRQSSCVRIVSFRSTVTPGNRTCPMKT
jgi:hypothetical protein